MRTNNRYRKPVLKSVSAALLIGFAVLAVVPSSGIIYSGNASSGALDGIEEEDVVRLTDPTASFDYDGTDHLKKNAYPEINELVSAYYNATLTFDMDTLEGLVSDIRQVNQVKLQAQLEYMESIDNIMCYTVAGEIEGTYRVYVYYDLKIRGIATPAPALSALYITMDSDGGYVVYLSELDAETQDFIASADTSPDVKTLKELVNNRFTSVVSSDEQLKTFCNMLEESASGSSASAASDQALATE